MDNTQLTVLVERCVMQINPDPFFDNSTLANIRKLFRYVFQEPWRNTETIQSLGGYLPAKVAETKEAWHQAGVAYTNGYRGISYTQYGMPPAVKRGIVAENKKLLAAVKRAKTKHEKYVKILAAFEAAAK